MLQEGSSGGLQGEGAVDAWGEGRQGKSSPCMTAGGEGAQKGPDPPPVAPLVFAQGWWGLKSACQRAAVLSIPVFREPRSPPTTFSCGGGRLRALRWAGGHGQAPGALVRCGSGL